MSTREFTEEEARAIGERIGIDWSGGDVDIEQFRMGLAVELEHGSHDPAADVTHDDDDDWEDRVGPLEGDPRLLQASGRDGARRGAVAEPSSGALVGGDSRYPGPGRRFPSDHPVTLQGSLRLELLTVKADLSENLRPGGSTTRRAAWRSTGFRASAWRT